MILFSDNGGSPLTAADNRPLRGSKYLLWEGGLRVPFMMRWPVEHAASLLEGLPKGKIYPHRVSTLDIVPTCLETAGTEVPKERDGASILRSVRQGTSAPSAGNPLFWRFQDQFAVREGDWKLVKSKDAPGRQPSSRFLSGPASGDRPQLFNLKDDLSEQKDVYNIYPEAAQRLEELYQEWWQEMRS